MPKIKENNFAFIDSNNLYLSISNDLYKKDKKIYSGWKLDYKKFRKHLEYRYGVTKAFLFIGFNLDNRAMYTKLQEYGYICVFKPTLVLKDGNMKGNVDAELVLHSMIEYGNYDKAVIVSGDGDFYCLSEYFIKQSKLKKILAPNQYNYSCLLKRLSMPNFQALDFMNDLKSRLEFKGNGA